MALDWDPAKARINFEKHGVRFSETEPVFRDDCAITIADLRSRRAAPRLYRERRKGNVLAVVYCYRADDIRIISARLATRNERRQYEEKR